MPHTVVKCLIQAVFSTKQRRNLISQDVRPRLWAYLGGIARENDMKALAVGGATNHAHVLLALPPTLAVTKASRPFGTQGRAAAMKPGLERPGSTRSE